ncbi:MAG: LexA family protein [Chlorobiota bacterium]
MTLYTRILENKNYNGLYAKNKLISNLKTNGLDLNKEVIDENGYTFLVEVSGNSMINAGINSGDKILVNSNYPITTGTIIVGSLNSKPFVKRILFTDNKTILRSENEDYEDIRITDLDEFTIWGAARRVIKDY